jgi:hypothetical protein
MDYDKQVHSLSPGCDRSADDLLVKVTSSSPFSLVDNRMATAADRLRGTLCEINVTLLEVNFVAG